MTDGKISCRAAITKETNGPFVIETIQVEPPKDGEVRVKVLSAGICHSDQHAVEGAFPTMPFPMIMGHEGSGVVESVGPGVTAINPGDGVIFLFEGYCGECNFCKDPKTNRCMKQVRNGSMMDGTYRMSSNGQALTQFISIGCFSEYVVVSEINVVKVENTKIPLNRLCLLSCCIPTGYGAAVNCAKVRPGSTCAVWGLGGVGLNIVLGCRQSGASKIIGIDINETKFPIAKKFGCTDTINSAKLGSDFCKHIQELTGMGPDYCFVSIGIPSVMEQAIKCANPLWGKTVIVGLSDLEATLKVGVWDLLSGKVVTGTLYGSYKAKLAIPDILNKYSDSSFVDYSDLISSVLPFEKINEGFDLLKTGNAVRTVIDFSMKP